MATVEKIRKDIEKTKEKIAEQQRRLAPWRPSLRRKKTWRSCAW